MYKSLFSGMSALVIATAALFPAAAAAQSDTPSSGKDASSLIRSGLLEGVNMATGSTGSASSISSTSSTTSSNSITNSSRTSTRVTTTTPRSSASATRAQSAPVPATAGAYVALGDSVAAGLGLPTKTTVPASERRCGRTAEAYPHAVTQAMGLPLVHKACSGATAGDLITKQRRGSPNQPAQFDTAFAGGKPALITITAGANDAHWDEFLRLCYSRNCANGPARPTRECIPDSLDDIRNYTTGNLADCYLELLPIKLHAAFMSIQSRSNNQPPTTIVTGYYNPISPACTAVTPRVTADEIAWLTAETNALNQTIQGVAAQYSFVRYAPVDFTGHDICSAQPWVQGLGTPAPFHPTAEGQQVIARSVLTALGR